MERTVADQYPCRWDEPGGQAFDEVNRAVLSPGAPDRDGEIAALFCGVMGKPAGDEIRNIRFHPGDQRLRGKKRLNRCIAPRERAQCRIVIGVGETAGVEEQIGVERHALFERERFEGKGDRRARGAVGE